jgi:hypothetical protein
MFRAEQKFPESLYETSDPTHMMYVKHHRMVVPTVMAYDIYGQQKRGVERLEKFLDGMVRSATLCIALDDIKNASVNEDWIEMREYFGVQEGSESFSDWRINKVSNARHATYDTYDVWTATRTIAKVNTTAKVRERYTITAKNTTSHDHIKAVIKDGEDVDNDLFVATATVYALDKSISKPNINDSEIDWSRFPNLASIRKQSYLR